MRTIKQLKAAGFTTLLLFVALGCDESLPPYQPVQNFTEGIISRYTDVGGSADTVSTVFFIHQCPNYCATQLKVSLKNIYEETLEGERLVRVWLELDAVDTPFTFHRQFYTEITSPPSVDLTLDPGSAFDVVFSWNRRDDDGILLDGLVDATYFSLPDPSPRRVTPPMTFRLRANIQVWKNIPPRVANEFLLKLIDISDPNSRCNVGCLE